MIDHVHIRAMMIGTTLLLLGSCGGVGSSPPGKPTMQGESMARMLADVDQIRSFTYGGSNQADAESAASDLVSWSNRMGELFPPGQATKEYVDMSPGRVRDAPVAMGSTATSLLAAVRTGNRSATGDQLARTERDGCGACHLSSSR